MSNFETKIRKGEVKLNPSYIDLLGNRDKLHDGTEEPKVQVIFNSEKDMVNIWFNKDSLKLDELDQQMKNQILMSGYSSLLSRIIKQQSNQQSNSQQNVVIQDIYEGFSHGGIIYGSQFSGSFKTYQPPKSCPYTGPYNYDVRCRPWYLESSQRKKITPIEPILYYSEDIPFLGTNLCQKQKQNFISEDIKKSSCAYSVNCLSLKLIGMQNFFSQSSFHSSTSIMIDPRSKIIVFNQLTNITTNITYLESIGNQLFPNDDDESKSFIEEIEQRVKRKAYSHLDDFKIEEEKNDQSDCEVDSNKIQEDMNNSQMSYQDYEFYLKKINLLGVKSDQIIQGQQFLVEPGQAEEVFVSLNFISIIEKIKNHDQSIKLGYNIQDLFLTIDILPKHVLTSWADELKLQINNYLLYFSISSLVICILLFTIASKISYQVGIMIETPLIHMTNLLNQIEKEGGESALDIINSDLFKEENIFLSEDSEILFQSLKTMLEMLHLAASDIFKVEHAKTLLQLNYQINFFKKFNNKRIQGICSNNMGNIHFQNGRYLESMEYYHQAIILAYYEAGLYEEYQSKNSTKLLTLSNYINKNIRKSNFKEDQEEQKQEEEANMVQNKKEERLGKNNLRLKSTSISDPSYSDRKIISFFEKEKNDVDLIASQLMFEQSESIKETIIDRKLNFSQALFMHNITQEIEQSMNSSKITNKVLNNPSKFQRNDFFSSYSHSQTLIDWEDYEKIILDLIELNQQLNTPSFGRSVILLTQLSLCYLKLGKMEQAADEQTLAIDNYECALELQKLRNKSKSETKQNDSFQYFNKFFNPNLSKQDTQRILTEEQVNDDSFNSSISPIKQNEQMINLFFHHKTQKNLKISLGDKEKSPKENKNNGYEEENSLINLFKNRQSGTRSRIATYCNQQTPNKVDFAKSVSNTSHFLKQELLAIKLASNNKIQQQNQILTNWSESNQDRYREPKSMMDCQQGTILKKQKRNNYSLSAQRKSSYFLQNHSRKQIRQNSIKVSSRKLNLSLPQRKAIKSLSLQPFIPEEIKDVQEKEISTFRSTSNSDPIGTQRIIQLKETEKQNSPTQSFPSQIQEIKISELGSKQKIYLPLNSDKNYQPSPNQKKIHNLNSPKNGNKHSAFSYHPKKIEQFENEQKSPRSLDKESQMIPYSNSIFKKGITRRDRSKTNKAFLKSKVNKNFIEEDLKQIQRYELPSDILLYYIGLQEARLLLAEDKHLQAANVLTDLLEKSKYYLPYYRLACLNVLKNILNTKKINTAHIKKIQNKFDDEITLKVSVIIAVNNNYKIAGHTCMHLVNEVLTKDDDMFSLILNCEDNLEEAISLISIKQLKSSGKYIDEILQFISGDLKEQQLLQTSMSLYHEKEEGEDTSSENINKKSPFFYFYNKKITNSQLVLPQNAFNNLQTHQFHKDKNIDLKQERSYSSPRNKFQHYEQEFDAEQRFSKYIHQNSLKNISYERQFNKESKLIDNRDQEVGGQQITLETENESNRCILTSDLPLSSRKKNSIYLSPHVLNPILPSVQTESQNFMATKLVQSRKNSSLNEMQHKKPKSISPSILPISHSVENDFLKPISLRRISDKECFQQDKIGQQNNLITQPEDIKSQSHNCSTPTKRSSFAKNFSLKKASSPFEKKSSNSNSFRNQKQLKIITNSSREMEKYTNQLMNYNNTDQIKGDIFSNHDLPKLQLQFLDDQSEEASKLQSNSNYDFNSNMIKSNCKKEGNDKKENIIQENINSIFHLAVRKSIFNFFNKDEQKFKMQKKLTQLKKESKQRKCVIFITDQVGIVDNQAYKMLQKFLYQAQAQLLVLQLNDQEQFEEKNLLSDAKFNHKSIIKYFYCQDKLLQYIRNKREPMKNFGVPLMVEHFFI